MGSDIKSLADIGTEILNRFPKLIGTLPKNQDDSLLRAQTQLLHEFERFQLFAANLSLVHIGHSSLDYRLRNADLLGSTVRRLLQDLVDSLEEVSQLYEETLIHNDDLDLLSHPRRNDEHVNTDDIKRDDLLVADYGEGGEGDVPAIDLILDSITDSLDRLFKLATKVRNPSTRQIASRVFEFKDLDEATGIDIITEYARYDHQHVMELLRSRDTTSLDEPAHYLVDRLARANTFRRKQFGYWRRRRRKLQIAPQPLAPTTAPETKIYLHVTDNNEQLPAPVQVSRTATSKPYTASILDLSKINLDDDKSTVSVSEYAPTARGLENEIIDWPLPCSKLKGKKHFECPYCFTLCASGYLEIRAWKAHLRRDLRPYVCTYEHCVEGDQLYDTRQDWLNHEASAHRRIWRCVEHNKMTFENPEKYEEHLRDQHQHDLKLQSSEMVRASQSTSTASDRPCPFCGVYLASASTLQDHVAFHLERVALFALPRSTMVDDESTGTGGSSDHANARDDDSRDQDFDSESLSDFAALETSSIRDEQSLSKEKLHRDVEPMASGQQLDQLAIRALDATDRSSGRVEISSFLEHVEAATSDDANGQQYAVEDLNFEPHEIYDKKTKDYSPGKRYSRVVVLLLYWDKVAPSYLDTRDEVDQLYDMFKKNFRYTVYKRSLNAVPGKAAKVLLQKYVADVTWEADEPNSLLIIYYAGHGNGNPGENGDIVLTGGNYHPGSKADKIIWSETERLVQMAEQSDVFLIFDCCYTGRPNTTNLDIGRPATIDPDPGRPYTRHVFSSRNFEYITASIELTKVPGKESFTSAMLHALGELSKHADGFTTQELYSAVQRAPNFPQNQNPIWGERGSRVSPKLLLAPLPDAPREV